MATVAALNEHRVNIQRTLALPAHAPLDFQQHFHRTVIFQELPKHKRAYVNLACNCVRFGAIQSMMVISYVKYLPRLAYQLLNNPFFILLTMKSVYRIFLYHAVYLSPILCYYVCVT